MNPRFEINDKIVDQASGRSGVVSGVLQTAKGFAYEVTWLTPTSQWGRYCGPDVASFQRVGTSWNKLMSPDDPF